MSADRAGGVRASPGDLERRAARATTLAEGQALSFAADRLRREPHRSGRAAIRWLLRAMRARG